MFWIVGATGAVAMWWDQRLKPALPFLLGLLLAGILAMVTGLQLRHHYFVLVLPALALLNGVMLSRAAHLLRHDKSIELFLALGAVVLFAVGVAGSCVGNGRIWFGLTPAAAGLAATFSVIPRAWANLSGRTPGPTPAWQ
jgi:hypothetical protein